MKKKHSALIVIVIIIMLLLIILPLLYSSNFLQKIPSENGTIQLCFSQQEDCSKTLEAIINSSTFIKAALYDLDQKDLINIIKAKNADVLVDEDNYFGYGEKITGSGLMHNKFWLVYDSSGKDYVITGSLNPTYNDFYKNDNNMVIITSEYLKKNYEDEFNELKDGKENKPTRYARVILSGNQLENYFCPDDGCEEHVLSTLQAARKSIYFMTFSFTSESIGNYLIKQKQSLDIRGVFDESQVKSQEQYTEYYKMLDNNMKVRLDGNTAKLHHKVFIIDNETVITGSYNPTSAGTSKNDENIIIMHNPEIAARFIQEFERVWQLAPQ